MGRTEFPLLNIKNSDLIAPGSTREPRTAENRYRITRIRKTDRAAEKLDQVVSNGIRPRIQDGEDTRARTTGSAKAGIGNSELKDP